MGARGKQSEGGQPKPRRRRRKRASQGERAASRRAPPLALLRGLGAAVALLASAAVVWLLIVYPSGRGVGDGHGVKVTLAPGLGSEQIADRLAEEGVLAKPHLFAFWLWATGGAGRVVPGPHLLTDDASPRELLARLERRGGGETARVTFPEGWTRFDIARRLEERHVSPLRDFLDATVDRDLLGELAIDAASAEGFLFPATYDFAFDSDPHEVVRRMKREFDRRWDLLSRARGASLSDVMSSAKLDEAGVVTLASLVEKEAAVDDERPIIASVFLNRLRVPSFRPKHLECDPTASYGCLLFPEKAASCATFGGKATAAIEHDPDNPYSTYTHEGLPPGPIANPGYKSLDAVMAPAVTPYFYFVARGGGRHAFSETYEAHLAAVHDASAHSR
jgi:peptidoglycan lytic transglycosylase G